MPYTYLVVFTNPKTLEKSYYYGVRFAKDCNPDELFKTYFTSSKYVKKLLEEYSLDNFKTEIRKVFSSKEEALNWEHIVLRRMKVLGKKEWLNRTDNKAIYYEISPNLGKVMSEETKEKIRKKQTGKIKSEYTRNKLSNSHKGRKNPHSVKIIAIAQKVWKEKLLKLTIEEKNALIEIHKKARERLAILENLNNEIFFTLRLPDFSITNNFDYSALLKHKHAKNYKLIYRKHYNPFNYSLEELENVQNYLKKNNLVNLKVIKPDNFKKLDLSEMFKKE